MKILAIDTSINACRVGFFDGETPIKIGDEKMQFGYADALIPMIKDVCPNLNTLEMILVTQGPGSFTGIRVGLSAARALAFALGIPCKGISTLSAVAYGQKCENFGVAIDTRRGDFYTQIFKDHKTPQSEPSIKKEDDIKASDLKTWVIDQDLHLEDMVALFLHGGEVSDVAQPIYVRPPDAEKPKRLPSIDW